LRLTVLRAPEVPDHRLGLVGDADLPVEVVQVDPHRPLAVAHLAGNEAVRGALGEQLEHPPVLLVDHHVPGHTNPRSSCSDDMSSWKSSIPTPDVRSIPCPSTSSRTSASKQETSAGSNCRPDCLSSSSSASPMVTGGRPASP